jgi:hypothetical protein
MDPILRSYITQDVVVTRSFAAAVFLHALGHPIEKVVGLNGSAFNAYYYFPVAARPDLERYYKVRDVVNATTLKFLAPDGGR